MCNDTGNQIETLAHRILWLLSKEDLINKDEQDEIWSDWDPNAARIHSCWKIQIPIKSYTDSFDNDVVTIYFYIKDSKISYNLKCKVDYLHERALIEYDPAKPDEDQIYTADEYEEALISKMALSCELQRIKGMIETTILIMDNLSQFDPSKIVHVHDDSATYKSLTGLNDSIASDLSKLKVSTATAKHIDSNDTDDDSASTEAKNACCDDELSLDDSDLKDLNLDDPLSPELEATSASDAVQSDEDYQEAYNKHAERLRNRIRKATREMGEAKDGTDSRGSSEANDKPIPAPKMQLIQADEKYFDKDELNQEMKDMKVKRYADHKLSRRDLVTGIAASAASNILDSQNAFDGRTPTGAYDNVLSAAFADTKQAFNDDSKFILKHESNGDNLYLASNHEKLITEVDEQLDKTERYQIEPAFALYLISLPDWQNIAGSKFDQAVSHYLDEQNVQNEFMRKPDETVARLLNDNLPDDADEDAEKESSSKKKAKR